MAQARKQVQGSLWGRAQRRAVAQAKRAFTAAGPVAAMPTHRPLTALDALYTVAESGRRVYVPIVVQDEPGKWAGREWCHCGPTDGVLVVPWALRDIPGAPLHWARLGGNVCVVEGGQAR